MKKLFLLLSACVLFCSHDMFLKLDSYFLAPHSPAQVILLNGTFVASENVIDRDRMLDVSLVGNGQRQRVDSTQWREQDAMTILDFTTGDAGTWVAGVSTGARSIELAAADFNNYLEHDGVLDMLEWRKNNGAMEQDAVERYSKHVKTIFQVGDTRTDDWQTRLGYPIEFVPMSNPYALHVGDRLTVQLLWQGNPLADQLVYIGSEPNPHSHAADEASHQHATTDQTHRHDHDADVGHTHRHTADEEPHQHATSDAAHSHGDDAETGPTHSHTTGEEPHTHATDEATHSHEHHAGSDHTHSHADADKPHSHAEAEPAAAEHEHHAAATQARTDANGEVTLDITEEGVWYVRTIHLTQLDDPELTHESNWATLTFEVGHSHAVASDEHIHEHTHDDSWGIPSYVYWLASIVVIGGLFLWFNRQTA